MTVFADDGEAGAFETLSTLTTAKGFTASLLTKDGVKAKSVQITCETADVRFCYDGTTPTVTAGTGAGHILSDGANFMVRGFNAVKKFRAINAVDGNNAALKCTFHYSDT
jgi:hypothetical protein